MLTQSRQVQSKSGERCESIRVNVTVSMLMRLGTGALNFVAAPLYARLVGLEGYGLIGFYLTLYALLQILEVGLTTATSRDLAIRSAQSVDAQTTRDFVRTVESTYWWAALLATGLSPAAAILLVNHWLRFTELSPASAVITVILLVETIAIQWPTSLYFGGLMGLGRLVLANAIYGVGSVVKVVVSLAVLRFISASPMAFFVAQASVTLVTVLVLARALWRLLPPGTRRARFQRSLLRGTIPLSAGISGVSLFTTCLNNIDKIVLSRHLSMADFGYYMLACTLAASLYMLVTPICAALAPTFARLVALGDVVSLRQMYAKSVQLVAVVLAPATIVTMMFASEIVLIWTRNPSAAEKSGMVAAILMPATLASAFLEVSMVVQRALALVRFSLWATAITALLLLPATIYGVREFGALGGAAAFAVGKTALSIVQIVYTGRVLGGKRQSSGRFRDIAGPLAACLVLTAACRASLRMHLSTLWGTALDVACAISLAYVTVCALTPVAISAAGDLWRLMVRKRWKGAGPW